MSVKLKVQAFEVEADSIKEAAYKAARHFGTIADGIPSDAGVAIATSFEYVNDEGAEV